MNKEQICECGHDKAFHEIDNRGWCIYGMVITEEGIESASCCACRKFKLRTKK